MQTPGEIFVCQRSTYTTVSPVVSAAGVRSFNRNDVFPERLGAKIVVEVTNPAFNVSRYTFAIEHLDDAKFAQNKYARF